MVRWLQVWLRYWTSLSLSLLVFSCLLPFCITLSPRHSDTELSHHYMQALPSDHNDGPSSMVLNKNLVNEIQVIPDSSARASFTYLFGLKSCPKASKSHLDLLPHLPIVPFWIQNASNKSTPNFTHVRVCACIFVVSSYTLNTTTLYVVMHSCQGFMAVNQLSPRALARNESEGLRSLTHLGHGQHVHGLLVLGYLIRLVSMIISGSIWLSPRRVSSLDDTDQKVVSTNNSIVATLATLSRVRSSNSW